VTLKIDFFREINLSLFVFLQIIQFSFETYFNESLRFRKIWIVVISNWTPRIDSNINKRKIDIHTLMNNIFYIHEKIMVGAWIECKKRATGALTLVLRSIILIFPPKCYLFILLSLFFAFDLHSDSYFRQRWSAKWYLT